MPLTQSDKDRTRKYLRYPYAWKQAIELHMDFLEIEYGDSWVGEVQAVLAALDAWHADYQVGLADRNRTATAIDADGEYRITYSATWNDPLFDLRQREIDLIGQLVNLIGLSRYNAQVRIERN